MWKNGTVLIAAFLAMAFATEGLTQSPPPPAQSRSADWGQADQMQNRARDQVQSDINRRGRQVSAEVAARTAQVLVDVAAPGCQVTEARFVGETNGSGDMFEASCLNGGGYFLQASTPPHAFDCLLVAAQAEQSRAQGVATPSVCSLAANQNPAVLISGHAREAGVTCEVDAGKVVGTTEQGGVVYEVGCKDADGYHVEKAAQGWNRTDCLQIMATGLSCAFTSADEQASAFKPLLAGTDISDCDARQIGLLAQNDTGRFIEIKCAAGEGYVARVKDGAVGQIIPCNRAQRIGSGCTMTPVPVAANEQ